MLRRTRKRLRHLFLDFVAGPFVFVSALVLRWVRSCGVGNLPFCRSILRNVGIFPIRDHYYDPFVHPRQLRYSLQKDRVLPGIDWNDREQLNLLAQFHYEKELERFPVQREQRGQFYYDNGAFGSGDAEYLYCMIRHFKPRRVLEVGSGYSTMMALQAMAKNREEDPSTPGQLVCIEPYEKVLPQAPELRLLRQTVEMTDLSHFRALDRHDILFIDSSHVIRPQGDVLFEFLEVLPQLRPGVLVQIHDIFSPRDYPQEWILEQGRLWNEQYLLEAFLTHNAQYKIIGALNYLKYHHQERLTEKLPILRQQLAHREPGSFWIMHR